MYHAPTIWDMRARFRGTSRRWTAAALGPELEQLVASSGARIHFSQPWWLRPFLARGVIGITLGRSIYLDPSSLKVTGEELGKLIRHEVAHVLQIERLGLVRFLWMYLGEYFRHRREGHPPAAAYRRISFEVEATAAEELPSGFRRESGSREALREQGTSPRA